MGVGAFYTTSAFNGVVCLCLASHNVCIQQQGSAECRSDHTCSSACTWRPELYYNVSTCVLRCGGCTAGPLHQPAWLPPSVTAALSGAVWRLWTVRCDAGREVLI